jgi:hypothetical protein
MANIPAFKNVDDAELFRSIFESTAEAYAYYFDVVRNAFFVGFKKDNYQLDGRTFNVLNDITSTLLYETSTAFKNQLPKYKDEYDSVFIPSKDLKEKVKEALDEFHKEFNTDESN